MKQDGVHLQGVEARSKADQPARSKRMLAFWIVAYALSMTIMGNNIPAPLYPVYQRLWHFSTGMLTVVFAVVAVGVFPALLFLGPLSDVRGRRPFMLASVAVFSAFGTVGLISALGPSLANTLLHIQDRAVGGLVVFALLGTSPLRKCSVASGLSDEIWLLDQ